MQIMFFNMNYLKGIKNNNNSNFPCPGMSVATTSEEQPVIQIKLLANEQFSL